MFHISHTEVDGEIRIIVDGELDLATSPLLLDRLRNLKASRSNVVLDLSAVPFIDSSGLRALLTAKADARADGWNLEISRNLCDQARRLVEMTGMEPVLFAPE